MIKVNVHEAKTPLSRYLARVEAGETLIICRHNQPIAELHPIVAGAGRRRRRFGLDEGKIVIPPAFFEPLPDDMLRYFHGEAEDER